MDPKFVPLSQKTKKMISTTNKPRKLKKKSPVAVKDTKKEKEEKQKEIFDEMAEKTGFSLLEVKG